MKLHNLALVVAAIGLVSMSHATFDRFQAYIGIDDGAKGRPGDGIFRVQVDGKEVFKSEVLRPGMPVKAIDIPIEGAQKLGLFIDDEGNGHGGDWGNWLDARLVDSKTGQFVFLTDLTPEEKAWIGACRDRNVVRQPMKVGGVTYLRGWGCISGSEMVFKGWEKTIEAHESALNEVNGNSRFGKSLDLVLAGTIPQGVLIRVDNQPISKSMPLKPNSQIAISADFGRKDVLDWFKSSEFAVKADIVTIPLNKLVQPTERWIQESFNPNRNVLEGLVPLPTGLFWGGKALASQGPRTLILRDLPKCIERVSPMPIQASGKLIVKAKPVRTNEVADAQAVTSSIGEILVNEKIFTHVITDNNATLNQELPLQDWPTRLECQTTPGADGSLADGFIIDIGIQMADMKEPLWLHTVDPSFQKFEYLQADKLVVSESWRVPGLGVVRWDNLKAVLTQRQAGLAELEKAKTTIANAKDKVAIDKAIETVIAVDPGQSEIRLVAAERYKALGDLRQERKQLGLMLETSRADLKTVQAARTRIDQIWGVILEKAGVDFETLRRMSGNEPVPIMNPLPEGTMNPNRRVGAYGESKGTMQLGQPAGLLIGPTNRWSRTVTVDVSKQQKVTALVNSRGVECSLVLMNGQKVIAQQTSRYPLIHTELPAGIKTLTLTLSVDPDATGILLDHIMDLVVWNKPTGAALPYYNWQLEAGVNARVSTTSVTPMVFALPRTATDLKISDGVYTLSEPTTEYLVQADPKLGGNNLVVFACPTKPGTPMQITYQWPDAAYNVPMSHFDWDRLGRVYLQTPAALMDTGMKSRWTVLPTQKDWKVFTTTPAPIEKDKMVFDVENQAGLSIVWSAKDVMTPWIAMKHKNLTMYIPDNPNNRAWFPLWMSYVREVYDKQVENTGFEKPNYLYVGVQGASMLSGYGGGTAGDDHTSETWLPATGRCSPYFWMHADSPSGVDSHELHWVHFGCFVEGIPTWVQNGFGGWIEETGWRCTDLANSENYMRMHKKNAAAALEMIKAEGKNAMQCSQEEWDALPGPKREKLISLGWLISEELYHKYGKDFWAKFWKEQRDKNAEAYKKLSPKEKDIFFVNELVRISKDPTLKDRFEKEWGFDLKS